MQHCCHFLLLPWWSVKHLTPPLNISAHGNIPVFVYIPFPTHPRPTMMTHFCFWYQSRQSSSVSRVRRRLRGSPAERQTEVAQADPRSRSIVSSSLNASGTSRCSQCSPRTGGHVGRSQWHLRQKHKWHSQLDQLFGLHKEDVTLNMLLSFYVFNI